MNGQGASQVTRRRVFYIPGYDPIPPRRYRELYRKEGAEQAAISGYGLSIASKRGANFGWSVEAEIDGAKTQSDIDVLVWSDIVQDSMEAGIFRTYLILIRTAWIYISTGALRRLMRLRRGPVIAALYPIGVLLVQALIAVLIVVVLTALTGWIGFALGLMAGIAALRWFKKVDGKIFAYYLMHDYGFSARWRGADPPALLTRMATFRAEIATALREDWDEVLIVGHSSGAHIAIQVLADLLRRGEAPAQGPALSFLSLGQVVPMVSFLPEAKTLRRDLNEVSQSEALFWLDVTAPGDPCSFALCDPVKVSGVAPPNQCWPLVISAAFTQTLSEPRQQAMKHRFFRRHFQYLCAFDRPDTYDYFKITAGGETLKTRFSTHMPSPSRIETPVNKFTEMV